MTKLSVATFCLYVGMAASEWILLLVFPTSLPQVEMGPMVLAILCLCAGISKAAWVGSGGSKRWRLIVSGLLLFGLPSLLLNYAAASLPSLTRVALLALVPAVVVLVANALGVGGTAFLGLLGASLAGMGGALLLLPADPALILERPFAGLLMATLILSLSVGGYLGHAAANGLALRQLVLLMLGPSAVLTGGLAMAIHRGGAIPGLRDLPLLLWSVVEILLLVHLVRVIPPVSLAVRFLLIPLITAVEGLVYLRPQVTWRALIGVMLLLFGSVRLLIEDGRPEEPSVSLL